MSSKKRVMVRAEEPHFLRSITHDDHLLQAKLPIPRKFMREYGSALSDSVKLKVPNGMIWKVLLVKSSNCILFGKGWEEFVLYHGIMHGHSVIFRYEGGCSFLVSILDKTSTEINYPCSSANTAGEEDRNRTGESEGREVKQEEEDCPEFMAEVPPNLNKKCKVPTSRLKPQKRKGNRDKSNDNEEEDDFPEFINEQPQSLRKKRGGPMHSLRPQKRTKVKVEVAEDQQEEGTSSKYQTRSERTREGNMTKALTAKEKADALRRAAAFKPANPFFKIVLQPSYTRNFYLPIGNSFSRSHLGKQCVRATLSCPRGRTWPVGLLKSNTHTRITSGWSRFVVDNGLKAGDVCVFELIKATEKPSFRVDFF